ncbi:hypothetical protein HMPREF1568_2522 [Providencia alcalifaciens PAL-3]|nr:hypothetical protein HMPREF1568_2522 [Providencia alcalifaciens PAL-3]EUC98530.1 hypothetical protein HMPREF1566_0222 [Providencia alcalifaciens PAL-1]
MGFFMAAAAKFASEDDDSCRYYPVKYRQWNLTLGHQNGEFTHNENIDKDKYVSNKH